MDLHTWLIYFVAALGLSLSPGVTAFGQVDA
jgi:threonine/homoserine/homoserine lactone efflux protein